MKKRECQWCGRRFQPEFPEQVCCRERCAEAHWVHHFGYTGANEDNQADSPAV